MAEMKIFNFEFFHDFSCSFFDRGGRSEGKTRKHIFYDHKKPREIKPNQTRDFPTFKKHKIIQKYKNRNNFNRCRS